MMNCQMKTSQYRKYKHVGQYKINIYVYINLNISGMVNIKLLKVVIYGDNVKVDDNTLNLYFIPF